MNRKKLAFPFSKIFTHHQIIVEGRNAFGSTKKVKGVTGYTTFTFNNNITSHNNE